MRTSAPTPHVRTEAVWYVEEHTKTKRRLRRGFGDDCGEDRGVLVRRAVNYGVFISFNSTIFINFAGDGDVRRCITVIVVDIIDILPAATYRSFAATIAGYFYKDQSMPTEEATDCAYGSRRGEDDSPFAS